MNIERNCAEQPEKNMTEENGKGIQFIAVEDRSADLNFHQFPNVLAMASGT